MAWWDSLLESQPCCPGLRARSSGMCVIAELCWMEEAGLQLPLSKHWEISLQALGNGSRCPPSSVNIFFSPHSPAALPNIPPSRKKTPFGIPLSSESFSVGETICLHSLPLPPLAVLLGPSPFMLFQTLAQKCFTLHTEAFMCNLMNQSNSSTESPCRDS